MAVVTPVQTPLLLVDASGFIFRAYHALPPLTTPSGVPIGAVVGFCNMLTRLLQQYPSAHVGVVFDVGRQNFRHTLYADYKANRPPPPDDLVPQFALVREATEAFGLPVLQVDGFEADDVMASYVADAKRQQRSVLLVSSDKDLMQLIDDDVAMLDPIKYLPLGRDAVVAKFGVAPEQLGDVLALMGDASDHVPGVPGIGAKTAAELIQQYHTLEQLLQAAPTIKQPKRRQALIDFADQARLSRQLVALKHDVPLPQETAQWSRPTSLPTPALIAFCQKHQLNQLLKRFGATDAISAHTSPALSLIDQQQSSAGARAITVTAHVCSNAAMFKPLMQDILWQGWLAIDIVDEQTVVISIDGAHSIIVCGEALSSLHMLMRRHDVLKICRGLKQTSSIHLLWLQQPRLWHDIVQMAYAVWAGMGEMDMSFIQQQLWPDVAFSCASDVVAEQQAAVLHAALMAKAYPMILRLQQQTHTRAIYAAMDHPLLPILARMEDVGVMVDELKLTELKRDYEQRLQQRSAEIFQLAGHEFNIASPKQMAVVLFDELALDGGRKTKSGQRSTDAEILQALADEGHVIAERILEWRQMSKLLSTYVDVLLTQKDTAGRVHTIFHADIAATGRLSSSQPNLQNIPVRKEEGQKLRGVFIAPPQQVLLSLDYSQIELRLIAHLADITAMKQAFIDGLDIHKATASQVLGVPLAQVSFDQRRAAKAINFGIIYGISPFGLAKNMGCSVSEAKQFMSTYFMRYPQLQDYMEETKRHASRDGFVCTLFGRRVALPMIRHANAALRQYAERAAINAPLQGTAADLMKRAMIRIDAYLSSHAPHIRMLLQVHDELLFEGEVAAIEQHEDNLKQLMIQAALPELELSVPLVVDGGVGGDWSSAHN